MKPQYLNRIDRLRQAFFDAKKVLGCTTNALVQEVVEHAERMGLDKHLSDEGVSFSTASEIDVRMRANTRNLTRWIGHREPEEKMQPEHILTLEAAIVAALPESVRLEYLRYVYEGCGLSITSEAPANSAHLCFVTLTREQCEAQVALADAIASGDEAKLTLAINEIQEAVSAGNQSISGLKIMLASQKHA